MSRSTFLFLIALAAVAGCAGAPSGPAAGMDEREIYRLLIEDQEMGPYGPILLLEDSMPTLRLT